MAALLAPSLAGAQINLATPPPRASASSLATPSLQATPRPSAAPVPGVNESVAAVVNDDIISTYDLQQRMRLLMLTTGVQPTQQALQQMEQEALRSLTDEHLELQELRRVQKRQKGDQKNGLIADDKEVDEEITGLARQNNLTYAQLKTSFAAAGVSLETLREQIRVQISWQRLVSGMYGGRIRIGEDQVATTLQRLNAAASQPQYLVGEIFIDAARAGGQQQALDGAQQLITQLQKGAPFPAVARQFSSAPTSAAGGDAGWVSAAQEPPEVGAALEVLRPGQLSAPIVVRDGVYIIYLRDKQAASSQTMVNLKQLAMRLPKDAPADQVAADSATLMGLRAQVKGCANLDALAAKAHGVVAADLGEAEITDLSGPFKAAAQQLGPGQVSEPIRTDVGLHLIAVCSKRSGSANLPSRVDLQNRLYAEQLSVMSRRYLRDLRNSADIETR
jgi:peptidyl-prolyl cis-trans isomerase SurA